MFELGLLLLRQILKFKVAFAKQKINFGNNGHADI